MTTATVKTDFLQEFSLLFSQLSDAKQKELITYIRNFFNNDDDNESLADALAFPDTDIEVENFECERVNILLRDCDLGD